MRAAIIGIGKMGLLHTSILSTLPALEVVAICDKSKMILDFAQKVFGKIKVVNSVDALADLDLDVVYVTTPIPSHFNVIKQIYTKKIASNLFVEKTLASSLTDATTICELARASGGKNIVGFERRHAVTFNKAYELMQADAIGRLQSFKAHAYSADFLDLETTKGARASVSRGGLLRDLCSHVIDLSLWFFGDLNVTSAVQRTRGVSLFEEALTFRVSSRDGIAGFVEASWCMKGYRLAEVALELIGTKGTLTVNDDQLSLVANSGELKKWYRLNLNDNVEFLLGAPEYYRENKHFIECINNDLYVKPNFDAALKVEETIEQVRKNLQK